jgi:hypothetical protein
MSIAAVWEAMREGNHRFGASWTQRLADVPVVCLIASVGLTLTAMFVALGYGVDLGQAFAVAG